ncbi:MAG: hypothetical protein Kow00127_00660 [Bacteroidales bacterium]
MQNGKRARHINLKSLIFLLLFLTGLLPAGTNSLSAQMTTEQDSLLHLLMTVSNTTDRINILSQLAFLTETSDPGRAESYANQAIYLAISTGKEEKAALARYVLAGLKINQKSWDEAYNLLQLSVSELEKEGEKNLEALARLRLALIYKHRLDFAAALESMLYAKELLLQNDNQKYLAEAYNMIGGIYFDQQNYRRAFEYYLLAGDLFKGLGDKNGIGKSANNLGESLRWEGQTTAALPYYHKARRAFEYPYQPKKLAQVYDNLAAAQLVLGRIDSAKFYNNLARDIADSLNVPLLISGAMLTAAQITEQHNDYNLAIQYYLEAFDQARKSEQYEKMRVAAKGLSNLYEKQGDYYNAFQFNRRYKSLNDSLNSALQAARITQLEIRNLLEEEQQKLKIERTRNSIRYFGIIAALIFLLVLLVLVYGWQRIRDRQFIHESQQLELEKKNLQEELARKERILAAQLINLVRKNEYIRFALNRIDALRKEIDIKERGPLNQLAEDLRKGLNQNLWKEFEDQFNSVHQGFMEKLLERHPNLTEKEKKLCALLRLNLSTKEIASFFQQSPHTIEVARTRMRRKMNLSQQKIPLTTYLASL